MTIAQNVAYPLLNQKAIQMSRDKMEPAVRDSLRFVELEQTMERYPSELSGGMRRRAAIARAVVNKPPLLLYDSPTAGLDPITAHTIMALIIKERDVDNTTALVVTHRYQDGNLVANFRYNPDSGRLDPMARSGTTGKTVFMVLREGRLIFEGNQADLEASADPYISKFVKRPERDAA
jgi:phospholipid/cholesterol/gamma-HCH transport system ATP-binding protein